MASLEWMRNTEDPELANTDDLRDLCRTHKRAESSVSDGEVGVVFFGVENGADESDPGDAFVYYGKSWRDLYGDFRDLTEKIRQRMEVEEELAEAATRGV